MILTPLIQSFRPSACSAEWRGFLPHLARWHEPVLAEQEHFRLKLAETPAEVAAAQKLRYRVFKQEQGRLANCNDGIDRDRFDRHCRHLIVTEKERGRIVGTYRVLSGAGVPMGMMLPSGTVVEEIRQAPAARVNVVVNPIGLPLAEKMKQAFGTPYVLFDKYIDPEQIYRLYQELFAHLGLPVPDEVEDLYQQAIRAVAQAEGQLEGLTYIYGNTPIECFAFNAFMVGLGMRPLLIQTSQLPERDDPDRQRILERCDPYVTKTANIAPLQYIYDVLRPNLYLGHEFAARLREKGIEMVHSDRLSSMLGLEVTLAGVTELLRAGRAARALREGRESA